MKSGYEVDIASIGAAKKRIDVGLQQTDRAFLKHASRMLGEIGENICAAEALEHSDAIAAAYGAMVDRIEAAVQQGSCEALSHTDVTGPLSEIAARRFETLIGLNAATGIRALATQLDKHQGSAYAARR